MQRKNVVWIVLIFLMGALPCMSDQYRFLGDVRRVEQSGGRFDIDCGEPKVILEVLSPDMVRIRMSPTGTFEDPVSPAVVGRTWDPGEIRKEETEEEVVIRTAKMVVRIRKRPCRFTFEDLSGNVVSRDAEGFGIGWKGTRIGCWKTMSPDEQIYGLGEKTGRLGKRGSAWTMWNTDDPAYDNQTDPLYQSHPFFIGLVKGKAYGIFFDNSYRSDFRFAAGSDDLASFEAENGALDYYFIFGPEIKQVISRYTDLVGRMSLPPLWALGYQQCRWSYYPESEVLRLARTFREKEIPCDVIYLDIHYMDGYRCFTWDKSRFPDPKKMIDELHGLGFKVVLIIDPGIKVDPGYPVYDQGIRDGRFCLMPDRSIYTGRVWPGLCAFPDFFHPQTRAWWSDLFRTLVEDGVDGFWTDMNEPAAWGGTFPNLVVHDDGKRQFSHEAVHNIYGFLMAEATSQGSLKFEPEKRPFVLTRAGFSGIQRHAAVWTGDNSSTWEDLALAVPMCLNLGLSGVPFVGCDVGGFIGLPTPELFTRWLELGSYLPLFRNHSAVNTPDQEPWVFGDIHEAVNKAVIRKRYEILPYLYDSFAQAARSGIPIMRPLVLEFQNDPETFACEDEFLLGDDLLIAPVVKPGQESRFVHFPEGEWVDVETNEKFNGPAQRLVAAPLEKIPVFARAGSVVPNWEAKDHTGEGPGERLILNVYPNSSSFEDSLYEDEGNGFDFREGRWSLTNFRMDSKNTPWVFTFERAQTAFRPPYKQVVVRFQGVPQKPGRISVDGNVLRSFASNRSWNRADLGWVYEPQHGTVEIELPYPEKSFRILIDVSSSKGVR